MRNDKGQFIQGNAGRPKGAKDKATSEIRQRFAELLDNNIERVQSDLDSLEPKDRLDAVFKLAQYILPKLKQVETKEIPEAITRIERHIIEPDGSRHQIEPITVDFTE